MKADTDRSRASTSGANAKIVKTLTTIQAHACARHYARVVAHVGVVELLTNDLVLLVMNIVVTVDHLQVIVPVVVVRNKLAVHVVVEVESIVQDLLIDVNVVAVIDHLLRDDVGRIVRAFVQGRILILKCALLRIAC